MGIAERWKGFQELPVDIVQRLKRLIPLFEREGVTLAYLFGSTGRGHRGNDVDLAILVEDRPAFRLRDAIVDCLGTERVDLVDLQRAPPVLRFEIVRTGHPVYVSDLTLQERFEMATIHLYRDTHHLRRKQEQHLREWLAQYPGPSLPENRPTPGNREFRKGAKHIRSFCSRDPVLG